MRGSLALMWQHGRAVVDGTTSSSKEYCRERNECRCSMFTGFTAACHIHPTSPFCTFPPRCRIPDIKPCPEFVIFQRLKTRHADYQCWVDLSVLHYAHRSIATQLLQRLQCDLSLCRLTVIRYIID